MYVRMSATDPLPPLLGALRCPALLTVGETDPMGPKASEIIYQAMPNGRAELLRIPGRGHWLQLEAVDEIVTALDAWLERHRIARLAAMLWRQDFANGAEPCEVVVHAGQEHSTRRCTKRCRAMLTEERAARRELINVGRIRFAAKCAKIHQGGIVHKHHNNVGSCLRLRRPAGKGETGRKAPTDHEVGSPP